MIQKTFENNITITSANLEHYLNVACNIHINKKKTFEQIKNWILEM